jgi:hypothetical protein
MSQRRQPLLKQIARLANQIAEQFQIEVRNRILDLQNSQRQGLENAAYAHASSSTDFLPWS